MRRMKVASWNVNSIRAREGRLAAWLGAHRPDVLCLQELKVEESDFPKQLFADAGYHVAAVHQKTYNGVAVAARAPLADVRLGLDDGVDDPQARLVAATVGGVRVISVYAPNGQAVGSDKYVYKLAWLERLAAYLRRACDPAQPLVLCGDFNVAPEARDVCDPASWAKETLFHIDSRAALERVRAFGLWDTFRLHHQQAGAYSWWDYRMLGFAKDQGLRIDQIYVSTPLARRCTAASIDREERKGQGPSDHAPIVAELDLA
jgi:exodeoxyribonuclease-3